MLLFIYGPNGRQTTEEAHPLHEGADAGRLTRTVRTGWIYFGF